ncbi:MAG: cation transporter [Chromatiales bacterium]|jgi:cation diffusion facilitator family transporter|nr:cation transporter [Chromatiales bacterium]
MTGRPTASERARVTWRVTLVGSVVDAALGGAKLCVGWLAQSQALIADGLHSLSDLATDLMVLVAARHASAEADDDHPYGHERIETLATVGLGVTLVAVGIAIAFDSVARMLNPVDLLRPQGWALWTAFISVVAKEALYHYTVRHARRVRSAMLEANAWHSRTDAISSLVVIVGLLGTMAGLNYVDAVAAVVVAWMIVRVGWRFAWRSARELVDTGLDAQVIESIRETSLAVDGVGALHELRTRSMGSRALVDLHIILGNPRVSVSEGHQISETVRARIIRKVNDVTDVMVHIDPEDDEVHRPSMNLPNRGDLERELTRRWAEVDGADRIQSMTFHYLAGQIHVDAHIDHGVDGPTDAHTLRRGLNNAVADWAEIGEVRLLGVYVDP